MQAAMFDGFLFDPFALFDDGFSPAEVGIGGRDVVEAFVIALMVVVFDDRLDLDFEVAWQIPRRRRSFPLIKSHQTGSKRFCFRCSCNRTWSRLPPFSVAWGAIH